MYISPLQDIFFNSTINKFFDFLEFQIILVCVKHCPFANGWCSKGRLDNLRSLIEQ